MDVILASIALMIIGALVGSSVTGWKHKKHFDFRVRTMDENFKRVLGEKNSDLSRWKKECEDRTTRLKLEQANVSALEAEKGALEGELKIARGRLDSLVILQMDYDQLKKREMDIQNTADNLAEDVNILKRDFNALIDSLKLVKGATRRDNTVRKIIEDASKKLNLKI